MRMSRVWAMPSPDTLSIQPIAEFVARHLRGVSIDPFARNSLVATYRNDLDPSTAAQDHLEAVPWLEGLPRRGIVADTLIFDPPYSNRQISECYRGVGLDVSEATRSDFYSSAKDAALACLAPDATVLSFGWNSQGMGLTRGFEILEILLVAHGGAHNDTICVAERRFQPSLFTP